MAARRIDPNRIKLHYSYTAGELAARLGVHKNTIRNWVREGLEPVDRGRPALYQGKQVRTFVARRNAQRKRPCPPGTLYCFRCRDPRPAAGGMIDYVPLTATSGNLRALCAVCEAIMHRRARQEAIAAIMPNLDVQITQAAPRLGGCPSPTLNCDNERECEI